MNPMLDRITDILQYAKAALGLMRALAAWCRGAFARRGKRKEKRRKKAEKQYLRMLRKAKRRKRRKKAAKWAKVSGRVARAIGRKYF